MGQIKAAQEGQNDMASKLISLKIIIKHIQAFVDWFPILLRNLNKNVKIAHLVPKLEFLKNLTISQASLNAGIVHPVEKTTPSQKDCETTHRLNQTGKIVGFQIVDHIIINGNEF